MASRKALLIAATFMVVAMGSLLPATTAWWSWPTNHVVGDNYGWMLGVNYDDWARYNTAIPVGDTLEFIYDTASHNVVQEDEDNYNRCIVGNNAETWDTGDDVIQLEEPGKYFFMSGIGDDCARGMKFAITAV